MSEGAALRSLIAELSGAHGFEAVGVCAPEAIQRAGDGLSDYLRRGFHGSMGWMEKRAGARAKPLLLWPDVRSIIVFAMSTPPELSPLEGVRQASRGLIATYAQGTDYHDVIKPRLKAIARSLLAQAGTGDVKVFVDTAPVMEKPLAMAAGLGWQGKNTLLVTRAAGCWSLLGVIYTTLDIAPDDPHPAHCGSCRRCLDVCPTNAFPAPHQLDARRCLSYLSIEHKGPIPHEFRQAMGNRIFGCDDCLAVCPWNRFAGAAREQHLTSRRDIALKPLAELLGLDDLSFRALFAKTPVKRTGRDRFLRNCLIAAGNSQDQRLVPPVAALLADQAPVVRGAAVWALSRLDRRQLAAAENCRRGESDPAVLDEWAVALDEEAP